MSNIQFDRNRFDLLNNFYGKQGLVPQTSHLTFVEPFVNGKGNYTFKINRDRTSTSHPIERYLLRNDVLAVKSLFIGIYIEPEVKPGHGVLYSYPVLTGTLPAGYDGLTTPDAEAVYNGNVEVKTGSVTNFAALPMRVFRNVPETQSTGTASLQIPEINWDKVRFNLAESLKFVGTKDQYVNVSFNAVPSTTIQAAAGFKAYLCLIADGWLIEGGTVSENKVEGNPLANVI
jgi:hypothetical protein